MDLVVFTGRMPVEEFKHDKPAEYKELVESGKLQDYLVEPYPPVVIKAIKIFAWIALTTGFSIIVWILLSMIFVYK